MKSHKYWSIGALITMLGTFYLSYDIHTEFFFHSSHSSNCKKLFLSRITTISIYRSRMFPIICVAVCEIICRTQSPAICRFIIQIQGDTLSYLP